MTTPRLFAASLLASLAFGGPALASPAASGPINAWANETRALLEDAMKARSHQPLTGSALVTVSLNAAGEPVAVTLTRADTQVGTTARRAVAETLEEMPRLPAGLRGKPVTIQFELSFDVAGGAGEVDALTVDHARKADAALVHNSQLEQKMATIASPDDRM